MSEKFTVKKLAVSGICLAIAFVLSFVTLFHMPTGGSVTLISMFFVFFVGYSFGPKIGFSAAFAYALLQFIQNRDTVISLWQILFDYILAFTALGLGSIFYKRPKFIIPAYLLSVLGRFVFTVAASVLFWSEYLVLPEGIVNKTLATVIASIIYNGAYIGAEALITVILLLIPPLRKALFKMKQFANR